MTRATFAAVTCAAFSLCAATAEAQTSVAAPTEPCELHVWPGNDLRSTYSGWLHGGIVDGAIQGRDGYRKISAKPLDTATQLGILKSQDLPELLALPGYHVFWHEIAPDSRTLRTTPGRLSPGTTGCYAELAVDEAFYQEDVFTGKYLKVLIRFRRFGVAPSPERTFGTILAEKLVLFPPLTPDADPAPAFAELRAAYARTLIHFGQQLNARPKTKR